MTKPGVKFDSVVPFSCNGFVLGSGEKSTVTPIPTVRKQQNQFTSKNVELKFPAKKRTGSSTLNKQFSDNPSPLKQSSLNDHFSPKIFCENVTQSTSGQEKQLCRKNLEVSGAFLGTSNDIVVLDTDSDENDADLISAMELSLSEENYGTQSSSQLCNSSSVGSSDKVDCPSCGASIEAAIINTHLDVCLL